MSDNYDNTPTSYFEEDMRAIIDGTQFPSRPPKSKMEELLKELNDTIKEGGGGGGGGTTNYNELNNKPQIAGTTLQGNKSLSDLGIAAASDLEQVADSIPDELADLTEDSGHRTVSDIEKAAWNGKQSDLEAEKDEANNVAFSGDIIDGQGNTLSVLAEALTKTASGNPVVIDDCAGGKARSLKTTIEAIQDLHGQSAPYVGGSGKNKLILDLATIKANNTAGTWNGNVYSIAGGTIEVLTDSDGNVTGFKVNGTFNAAVTFLVCNYSIALTADTFIFTCGKSDDEPVGDPTTSSEFFSFISGVNGAAQWLASTIPAVQRTFTVTDTSKLIRFAIYVASGKSVSNQILYPMIRKSTDATGFAPWENKCPISGRTEARVDTENEDGTESAYATIQLGTTVYGAEINWDTGVMTVKTACETFDNTTDWPEPSDRGSFAKQLLSNDAKAHSENSTFEGISNCLVGASGNGIYNGTVGINCNGRWLGIRLAGVTTRAELIAFTTATPIQVEYPLANPFTIQLTPTQLELLKGVNRVSIDNGTITLDYVSKADSIQAEVDALDANKAEKTTIAPVENGTKASKAYAVGKHFIRDDKFCTVIAAIASGATLTKNTNYVEGTIADNLPKQVDFDLMTNERGNVTLTTDLSRTIIAVKATDYFICTLYRAPEGTGIHVTDTNWNLAANRAVSGTYYYI